MYYAGEGAPESKVEAYKWFYIAAVLGSEAGRQNRDVSADSMLSAEIMTAESLARSWLSSYAGGDDD